MYLAKFLELKQIWAILSMGENRLGETSEGGRKCIGPNFREKFGRYCLWAKMDWAKLPNVGENVLGQISGGENDFGRYCLWAKMDWAKLPGAKKFWAKVSMGEKTLGETTGAKHDWAKIPGANLPVTKKLNAFAKF